jgi:hypothetical protein
MSGHAADRQSAQVRLDGGRVQTDGLLDRCERHGQQASLHRVAQHQDVGRDAVARQFHGELTRRQNPQGAALERIGDGRAHRLIAEVHIIAGLELAGRRHIGIEDRCGASRTHRSQHSGSGTHDHVACDEQVGHPLAETRGVAALKPVGVR